MCIETSKLQGGHVVYVLKLSPVFVHLRANGNFIEGSSSNKLGITVEFFDVIVIKEIFLCTSMKRTILAHQITSVVFYHCYFEALFEHNLSIFSGKHGSLFEIVHFQQQAFAAKNDIHILTKKSLRNFKNAWGRSIFKKQWQHFKDRRREKKTFNLFPFIYEL